MSSNLLKDYTTLQIGGPVKEVIIAKTEEELIEALKKNPDAFVIGGGSNLLVSDQGLDKVVIRNVIPATGPHEVGRGIQLASQGEALQIKSGTPLQDLVNFSIQKGLAGLQKLTGIPGTLGGAIYGNAGAYGQTISDHLISVKAYDLKKQDVVVLQKDECGFDYRDSEFKSNGLIILEATFMLTLGNKEELQKEADETIAQRIIKYPPGIKCPGSFFKNIIAADLPEEILKKIPGDKVMFGKIPSGYLLEAVGAKGDSLGQIKIAPYHGNLFINEGDGTAEDFYNLAKKYYKLVKEKFRIELEPEVQLINLPPLSA